jgi:hypothetical protein
MAVRDAALLIEREEMRPSIVGQTPDVFMLGDNVVHGIGRRLDENVEAPRFMHPPTPIRSAAS